MHLLALKGSFLGNISMNGMDEVCPMREELKKQKQKPDIQTTTQYNKKLLSHCSQEQITPIFFQGQMEILTMWYSVILEMLLPRFNRRASFLTDSKSQKGFKIA